MLRSARVDVNDLGSIIGWLAGQWWAWAVVGVIVLIVLVLWLLPDAKVKPSDAYPTTGTEANEIALGFLQIHNLPSGPWNDPTASGLTDRERKQLVDQWGIHSRDDWLANIERLVGDRRRRDLWGSLLGVRAELARSLGRPPRTKEWVAGIIEAGGDKRTAKTFVAAVESIEHETRKTAGKDAVPADVVATSFDGYAFGQAVALTTWGVHMRYGDVDEARTIIRRVNDVARPAFGSWAEFGLSYTVGRVMHWSDGNLTDKTFEKLGSSTALDLGAALSEKREGPWATLPWTR